MWRRWVGWERGHYSCTIRVCTTHLCREEGREGPGLGVREDVGGDTWTRRETLRTERAWTWVWCVVGTSDTGVVTVP